MTFAYKLHRDTLKNASTQIQKTTCQIPELSLIKYISNVLMNWHSNLHAILPNVRGILTP